ncbi:50S ribosomal protein L1 [Enterobacteriaceae bacterium ET-AT1-13]|nr:50S ribosomal protein L1 [Enterobacteriaceae bacterium ET-AT1-13]WGS66394.1 50S ribosomal protein L1 [Enterobacteriaceae bacterium Cmel17]WMC17420.1 MAG: 50S ribosomal protein L1 [Enterobacteriaceae bacterium Cmel21]WMC17626.1 MAG: 50S ribosomal protein L1 [Enterobacteriaceae bacterium PSmelAO3-2]WMC17831.1 MAG: 50S ribosomal protein L1 [Enterobacteriaceae bacterium PSmelAO3-1]WMC18034.1 MAG: 50S ribosomal protein L1 [Enterobacteriaceae bacterium PSmelAO1]
MSIFKKRMSFIRNKINFNKEYKIQDAINIIKELSIAKFIESIDVAINLAIDIKKKQIICGNVLLPYGTGRLIKIAVFAEGLQANEAKKANADYIGMQDLAEKIINKKINFQILIASKDSLYLVNKLSKIIGPKGLMPDLKFGTISNNLYKTVKNFKFGQIIYKNDKNGILHNTIGKTNFNTFFLKENLETLLNKIKLQKPHNIKGNYIKKITLSSTMGISLIIDKRYY